MSVTAPWDPRAAVAVGAPLRRVYRVQARHPAYSTPIDLDVDTDADPHLTHDEGWAPYVSADVTVRVPEQATLDLLDPRVGARLLVSAGYVYPGGTEDVHTVADLVLSERTTLRPENRVRLTGLSDEYLVQGAAPVTADLTYNAGSAMRNVIAAIIHVAIPAATIVTDPAVPATSLGQTLTIERGAEGALWSAVADLADRLGAKVYHDGLGTWRIMPAPVLASVSVAQLRTGPTGAITASEAALTRDGFANAVVIKYADGFAWAEATTGPLGTINAPRKVACIDRSTLPKSGGAKAARSILARTLSRGRSLSVTALDALWVTPFRTVTVQLPTGPQERHLIARTQRNLETGLMTVTTRLPDNATITSGE